MNPNDFQIPARWSFQGADESVALFTNAEGDGLSINHFAMPPDIAADISDATALRSFYRTAAEAGGVAMLEVDPTRISGLPAVRTILKARLEPGGFGFIGSLTLPFEDRSYVIKVQSLEGSPTGMRETAVMVMQPGAFAGDERTGKLIGWEQDPYDAAYQGAFMRNAADDEKYDATFPDHPLSKVRGYLKELAGTMGVSAEIRAGKPFVFPRKKPGLWARLWR